MPTKMKTNTKLIFLSLFLTSIDQTVKYFSNKSICNLNIAWSLPVPPAIFYFAWGAIISLLIYIFLKTKSFFQRVILTFIFSGAVSNLIDRIRLGCVVDYIDLKFWPVFNLADTYITIGIIIIVINFIKKSKPRSGLPNF